MNSLKSIENVKLHLAPMEGVVDWALRDLMTSWGSIDQCVTEFIRITDQRLPRRVYYAFAPELKMGCRTRSGTPLFIQLLGGNPEALAENAAFVCELGAKGIDLNFGCPSKLVNHNDGGAVLLKSPRRLYDIVSAVKSAIPEEIPVTAKMRLGYDDPGQCYENAQALADAGVQKITIHCRTKTDGYKPPAYWEWIPKIKEKVKVPIIPNGEIWTLQDLLQCHEVAQCEEYMIGRGALAHPFIFQQIKNIHKMESREFNQWSLSQKILLPFFDLNCTFRSEFYAQAKLKQMLRWMTKKYPEAQVAFDHFKLIHDPKSFRSELEKLAN
ncbi:MAG TPA: tRNA-dihydrouridine synthase family protein [Pseudobdellovibrionaceae bacterium]|nr:tRNA-dihydrouridine synthase family protein [Pseudobdellovibrionaceae bacterium]